MGGGQTGQTTSTPVNKGLIKDARPYFQEWLKGIPSSSLFHGGLNPTETAAYGQARQFGAEGLSGFMKNAQELSNTGGQQEGLDALDRYGSQQFADEAMQLRENAGALGTGGGSGFLYSLNRGYNRRITELSRERLGFINAANDRRLSATQLGLVGIPGAISALANLGGQENAAQNREYQDMLMRQYQFPLQAFSAAAGAGGSKSVGTTTDPNTTGQQALGMISALLAAWASSGFAS